MGTLAFDPDELAALIVALTAAADRLGTMHSDDPEAQPALQVAAAARGSFEQWTGHALDVAGAGAIFDYRPLEIHVGDVFLALDHVLSSGYGWHTTTDPLGDEWFIPLAAQAAALGAVLSGHGVPLGSATDEFKLLVELRRAIADPAALAALRANLPTDATAALAEQLARHRADLVAAGGGPSGSSLGGDDALAERVALVDQIGAALATVAIDPTRPLEDALATLASMRPVAAALLIAGFEGPDEMVVALGEAVMVRYFDYRNDPDRGPQSWEVPDTWSVGIGDVLFPRIARCAPAAANQFVRGIGTRSLELLTATVRDPASTIALMQRATDPAGVSRASTGAVLVPFLRRLQIPPAIHDVPSSVFNVGTVEAGLRPLLGALVAPWLLEFSREDRAFTMGDAERDRTLRWIFEDDQAFADLMAGWEHWASGLPLDDPGGDVDVLQRNLDEVGAAVGQLTALIEERTADDAVIAQAQWDLVVSLLPKAIGKGLGYVGVAGFPAKVVMQVVDEGVERGSDYAQRRGVLGAPTQLATALHAIELRSDQTMAVGAYLSMVAMRTVLIAQGLAPADLAEIPRPWASAECPTGDYSRDTREWLDANIADPEVRARLDLAGRAFMAPGSDALACQRLS